MPLTLGDVCRLQTGSADENGSATGSKGVSLQGISPVQRQAFQL